MSALEEFTLALDVDVRPAPVWAAGDEARHPTLGVVVIGRVDGAGAFPRYLAYGGPLGASVCLGWVSGAFLS